MSVCEHDNSKTIRATGMKFGTVHLTDLHLKPEALAGFDLPIEVKGGCIGKISIDIPWTSLYYEPVLVHIEEVLVLAGPTADRKYDLERDKRLSRAHKNRRLENARPPDPEAPGDRPRGFMENLVTTIVNNVQVSLQNVHIRYEDTVSTSGPLACGLVLQNLTAVTTNSKWKATQIDTDARSLFKTSFNGTTVTWCLSPGFEIGRSMILRQFQHRVVKYLGQSESVAVKHPLFGVVWRYGRRI
ncbi:Vacuolar protein sorting-associated protein 13 [Araneus ventricosus]|uniref:Vacuolar protein sorting-associated protein 13 n=1 Tax=Araneus ventricosus TaxID=182803 RepID=A0A4Y2FPL3_ARAVE|nr:Vacuolar protein sorting-associated protein 13 [Araneus ventricosus]